MGSLGSLNATAINLERWYWCICVNKLVITFPFPSSHGMYMTSMVKIRQIIQIEVWQRMWCEVLKSMWSIRYYCAIILWHIAIFHLRSLSLYSTSSMIRSYYMSVNHEKNVFNLWFITGFGTCQITIQYQMSWVHVVSRNIANNRCGIVFANLRPGHTHVTLIKTMCLWAGPSLFHVMAWWLFVTKPFPD